MGQAKRKPNRRSPRKASLEFSRELVFYDDTPTQRAFKTRFSAEIDAFVSHVHSAHAQIDIVGKTWARDSQAQYVFLFLHAAVGCLYNSVHFLVSGYAQASGQQMRNAFEATAMALLALIEGEWKKMKTQKDKYPAHKAIARVTRAAIANELTKRIGLDMKAWAELDKIASFYDQHSHSGMFALATHVKLASGQTIMGGEFDHAKQTAYRTELLRAASTARALAALVEAVDAVVPKRGS